MLLKIWAKVSELAHSCHSLGRTQAILPQLSLLGGFVLVFLLGQVAFTQQPAAAILRQHQDAPGIMRYHSQQSLPDEAGNAWQVVLFKQITLGQPTLLNLRLVGFPGIAQLIHPQSLEITTASGQVLTAPDVFPEGAPAPNVGQYNFTHVLTQLSNTDSLTLSSPVKADKAIALKIPQPLVVEWQWLVTEFH